MSQETWTLEELHHYQATGEEPGRKAKPQTPPKLDRYRSDTERRYAAVLALGLASGELRQWWYEPMRELYLAPKTSITVDFLLQYSDGRVAIHEVKGEWINPASWVKLKQAAALYPLWTFVLAQWKRQRWTWKAIPAC